MTKEFDKKLDIFSVERDIGEGNKISTFVVNISEVKAFISTYFLPKSEVREMMKKAFELGYSKGNDIQIDQKYLMEEDKQIVENIFNDLLKDLDL
jgi:hypothetical protein